MRATSFYFSGLTSFSFECGPDWKALLSLVLEIKQELISSSRAHLIVTSTVGCS